MRETVEDEDEDEDENEDEEEAISRFTHYASFCSQCIIPLLVIRCLTSPVAPSRTSSHFAWPRRKNSASRISCSEESKPCRRATLRMRAAEMGISLLP